LTARIIFRPLWLDFVKRPDRFFETCQVWSFNSNNHSPLSKLQAAIRSQNPLPPFNPLHPFNPFPKSASARLTSVWQI
jgi:hypothetical protein